MRILVAIEPADFRKGIDGLARVAREELDSDPFSGWIFVFRNRKATAVKILVYDGQGFWLCYKRLSRGRFRFWPGGQALRRFKPTSCRCCSRPAISQRPGRRRRGAACVLPTGESFTVITFQGGVAFHIFLR